MNRLFARLGVHRREHVSVARDFSFSSANSVSLVLLLSTALLLRRYLGPYLTGIWVGLELLPTYVGTYGHLGALTAAERELPFLLGAQREDEFERLKHTLFWFAHGVGLLLALGLVAAAFVRRPHVNAQTFDGLLLYAPILWAQLAATYYVVLYRARKRFGALSLRQGRPTRSRRCCSSPARTCSACQACSSSSSAARCCSRSCCTSACANGSRASSIRR